jgi:DNA-binding transcriptional ArsR family regulator
MSEQLTDILDVLTIDRPEQLKALGHPLRLRVLELLGDEAVPLTNRELANRLSVDPGHLHFHVRMLLKSQLIELVTDGATRREKPYRAVARTVHVAPELISKGLSSDIQAAMLEQVQRSFVKFSAAGTGFRAIQDTLRVSPQRLIDLLEELVNTAHAEHDDDVEPVMITAFVHAPVSSE